MTALHPAPGRTRPAPPAGADNANETICARTPRRRTRGRHGRGRQGPTRGTWRRHRVAAREPTGRLCPASKFPRANRGRGTRAFVIRAMVALTGGPSGWP